MGEARAAVSRNLGDRGGAHRSRQWNERVRVGAANFISSVYHTPNMTVVSVDTALLSRALDLYRNRLDKEWGLTDCISFAVMKG
jgi:predicted nucleic acid-binding protein